MIKGILLAGGRSTRLYPLTSVISKQLLPIYDKPMVYYPLAVLMLAGIREILLITRQDEQSLFQKALGNGESWGIQIHYAIQEEPKGIADALIIGESFIKKDSVCLMLGDNLLYGEGLPLFLKNMAAQTQQGATIFGYRVRDPSAYGVVRFSKEGKAVELVEKPKSFVSSYAIPGIYFYDHQAPTLAKSLKPSARGELEITDLNHLYLEKDQLHVELLGRGITWLDTGTAESLFQATQFVQVIEQRQGLKIACLEEIAYRMGYINEQQFRQHIERLKQNQYGQYLEQILQQD